jgi:hypothetical protein
LHRQHSIPGDLILDLRRGQKARETHAGPGSRAAR